MNYSNLVNAEILRQHLDDPDWLIFDCQFDLKDKHAGRELYKSNHIPGAYYADLSRDLSSTITPVSGRHPLPDVSALSAFLGNRGISNDTQVVVYDSSYGCFAARLWWLLRWVGHKNVAVLNGGITHWINIGFPVSKEIPSTPKNTVQFDARPDISMTIYTDSILSLVDSSRLTLVDVRDRERFLGLQEPLDDVAGHIPGAINIPWKNNLDQNGLYLESHKLKSVYKDLLDNQGTENLAFMCGSGVTACHSLVAMDSLGIHHAKLYPGSWSEWIRDPRRPVQKNQE